MNLDDVHRGIAKKKKRRRIGRGPLVGPRVQGRHGREELVLGARIGGALRESLGASIRELNLGAFGRLAFDLGARAAGERVEARVACLGSHLDGANAHRQSL